MPVILPQGYKPHLTVRQTQIAIKKVKDFFQNDLANQLNLRRVSAPLFVDSESGLNDDLSGVERPVSFDLGETGGSYAVVHSLAKWKRMALRRYGFTVGEGLYTDMNAIRRDEITDNIHSVFVDQWDWEKVMRHEERTEAYLHKTVRYIYDALRQTENYIADDYNFIDKLLPEEITFITAQELENRYPTLTPKERELRAVKEYGAVFLQGIGGTLASGEKHDGRAPDYDDWNLNGDLLFWNEVLEDSLEISSMGIRVDDVSLISQLEKYNAMDRLQFDYHRMIKDNILPLTIGGGIGQSRLCLLLLENRFQNCTDLRRHAVKQNAYTVDLCGKNSDADGRSNENCNRNSNLIPRHRTHTNSRKHSHRRGERNI